MNAPSSTSTSAIPTPAASALRAARVFEFTQLPYDEALELQRRLVADRIGGESLEDAIVLLEHPHTYTLGRSTKNGNVLFSPEILAERGIQLAETDRGGDVTYHGPGQLVIYPIVDLTKWKRDIAAYVHALEEVVVRTLADFGIKAHAGESARGVWAGGAKIASVGVRVQRWITMHGIALNVNTGLEYFDGINPCGVPGCKITSMAELGFDIARQDEVREAVLEHFSKIFGRTLARDFAIQPGRKPPWIRAKLLSGERALAIRRLVAEKKLNTVCVSARCPNLGECWDHGSATFMINGDVCTRSCSFCAVLTGRPTPIDLDEPRRVAEAAETMGLDHVVVTAVNRDERKDGGAPQFAATIRELRARLPKATIEVLIPDFRGNTEALRAVFDERPDVLNHNIETVPRLYRAVRPQADYRQSLGVLAAAADAGLVPKSGFMLGLGERRAEIEELMRDLKAANVRIVTIGQYLRPSAKHHPVIRYVEPAEFDEWREYGLSIGFDEVASGPMVRSSYHAGESFLKLRNGVDDIRRIAEPGGNVSSGEG